MSDSEVRRLEDRIDRVNSEGQLRLDAAMARIDTKFEAVLGAVSAIKTENDGVRDTLKDIRSEAKSLKTTMIVTAIATVLAIAACLIGMKQIWIGGVQVGQQISQPALSKPAG